MPRTYCDSVLPPGDADVLVNDLYARHAQALHGYALRFCRDSANADDIVQETFIRAWRHLPQLRADDRPIRPWLFHVARNLATDAERAARARPVSVALEARTLAQAGHEDTALEQVLDRRMLEDALEQLSPAHRSVVFETFYIGGGAGAVADHLGIPTGTARSRLHYALRALRRELPARDACPRT
jgi:RNA polymerase sigma-70 factor (ECF subfamily)